jgi:hypothetical protein
MESGKNLGVSGGVSLTSPDVGAAAKLALDHRGARMNQVLRAGPRPAHLLLLAHPR